MSNKGSSPPEKNTKYLSLFYLNLNFLHLRSLIFFKGRNLESQFWPLTSFSKHITMLAAPVPEALDQSASTHSLPLVGTNFSKSCYWTGQSRQNFFLQDIKRPLLLLFQSL